MLSNRRAAREFTASRPLCVRADRACARASSSQTPRGAGACSRPAHPTPHLEEVSCNLVCLESRGGEAA